LVIAVVMIVVALAAAWFLTAGRGTQTGSNGIEFPAFASGFREAGVHLRAT
jgi:hypothetical protein